MDPDPVSTFKVPPGNLPPASLPPVSTTQAELVAKFATGVLTCEYLREFVKKIRNDPNVIFVGLGEGDS
jgi:hypothetical protein